MTFATSRASRESAAQPTSLNPAAWGPVRLLTHSTSLRVKNPERTLLRRGDQPPLIGGLPPGRFPFLEGAEKRLTLSMFLKWDRCSPSPQSSFNASSCLLKPESLLVPLIAYSETPLPGDPDLRIATAPRAYWNCFVYEPSPTRRPDPLHMEELEGATKPTTMNTAPQPTPPAERSPFYATPVKVELSDSTTVAGAVRGLSLQQSDRAAKLLAIIASERQRIFDLDFALRTYTVVFPRLTLREVQTEAGPIEAIPIVTLLRDAAGSAFLPTVSLDFIFLDPGDEQVLDARPSKLRGPNAESLVDPVTGRIPFRLDPTITDYFGLHQSHRAEPGDNGGPQPKCPRVSAVDEIVSRSSFTLTELSAAFLSDLLNMFIADPGRDPRREPATERELRFRMSRRDADSRVWLESVRNSGQVGVFREAGNQSIELRPDGLSQHATSPPRVTVVQLPESWDSSAYSGLLVMSRRLPNLNPDASYMSQDSTQLLESSSPGEEGFWEAFVLWLSRLSALSSLKVMVGSFFREAEGREDLALLEHSRTFFREFFEWSGSTLAEPNNRRGHHAFLEERGIIADFDNLSTRSERINRDISNDANIRVARATSRLTYLLMLLTVVNVFLAVALLWATSNRGLIVVFAWVAGLAIFWIFLWREWTRKSDEHLHLAGPDTG